MIQLRTLKRTFDQFDSEKSGSISVETLNTILKMMGMHVSSRALDVSMIDIIQCPHTSFDHYNFTFHLLTNQRR